MAENSGKSGFMPFVVGGLVVAVAVMAYFLFVQEPADSESLDISISEEGVTVD
jgi:hypothetical protein